MTGEGGGGGGGGIVVWLGVRRRVSEMGGGREGENQFGVSFGWVQCEDPLVSLTKSGYGARGVNLVAMMACDMPESPRDSSDRCGDGASKSPESEWTESPFLEPLKEKGHPPLSLDVCPHPSFFSLSLWLVLCSPVGFPLSIALSLSLCLPSP